METPDQAPAEKDEEQQETISDIRIHPDDVLSPVAEKEEFIRPGEWIYSFEDALYSDVLTAAWLEGYIVQEIIDKGDKIHVKIIEERL